MRHVSSILPIFLLAATALAAQGPPMPPDTAQPPDDAPPGSMNLVHQLERLAAGKPIPVAAAPEADLLQFAHPMPDVAGKPILEALGLIGDAFSSPREADLPGIFQADAERRREVYQPYGFKSAAGNVWTVARDRRLEESTPLETQGSLADIPDFILFEILVHSLDAPQLRRATGSGLRLSDLTDFQKSAFRLLFGRPYALYNEVPAPEGDTKRVYLSESDKPLPVDRCALRLYIGFGTLRAPTGKLEDEPALPFPPGMEPPADAPPQGPPQPQIEWYDLYPKAPQVQFARREIPAFPPRAATFDPKMKPSDLNFDAPALAAPIGISGVTTLQKAVEAAAKASRLQLVVDKRLGCLEAFVGASRMSCGDALRLLTYSFDGAWRKVGRTYLLTWDRTGSATAALAKAAKDVASSRRTQSWHALEKKMAIPGWLALAEKTLGPPPGLPLAPTPEQWLALTTPEPDTPPENAVIRSMGGPSDLFEFANLTPEQQDMLSGLFANRMTTAESDPPNAPFPVTALQKSQLLDPELMAYLDIPGAGAVRLSGTVSLRYAFSTMDQRIKAAARLQDDTLQAERKKALAKPPKLDYATRAVAPPPLTAAEWARLLDQMKRKGLDTVYVPVFWDGQTLFPSAQFPQLAECHGEDLLARVLALGKARGIHVVATVNVLAWRFPGSSVHWLSKHPEFVDIDASGHPRRDWGLKHPFSANSWEVDTDGTLARMWDSNTLADLVRPTEPAVKSRLLGLVRELKRYKGLDGVALTRWTRLAGPPGYESSSDDTYGETTPPLGFTLPDRIAFLRENQVDPLDIPAPVDSRRIKAEECNDIDFRALWADWRYSQDCDLAATLSKAFEAGWPHHVQLVIPFEPAGDMRVPPSAVIVSDFGTAPKGSLPYLRIAPPSIPPPELDPDAEDVSIKESTDTPEQARRKRLDLFHTLLCGMSPNSILGGTSDESDGKPPAKGVVLDFTGSPDLLWDGLALLPNR